MIKRTAKRLIDFTSGLVGHMESIVHYDLAHENSYTNKPRYEHFNETRYAG
jgi:hypothetical protein